MIHFLADYVLLIILCVGLVVALLDVVRRHRWDVYARIVMAGLSSLLAAKLLSVTYQPNDERPFEALQVAPKAAFIDNPGFPSDHALLAVAAIGALYVMTRSKRLAACLIVLAVMMMVGRIIALVHTPLDILGGVLSGIFGMLWYTGIKRK